MSSLEAQLMEADQQLERQGAVWQTLRRIAGELNRLNIPFAIVGGIALQHHGVQRSTQDVNLLVDSEQTLRSIHDRLVGHGYLPKSANSRRLRDEATRVCVILLVAGEFPGDGRPKPVQFPKPSDSTEQSDEGLPFIRLEGLIEIKLASAKSAPHRIKDRADVLELIHLCRLDPAYAERLNPYVRPDFLELAALPPPSEQDD